MTQLQQFFLNEIPDNRGRYLDDMLSKDFAWMEETHDFVQWWFPNAISSRYNVDAPLLTEQDIHDIMSSTDAKINFMCCVRKMLYFFGFAFDGSSVVKSEDFESRKYALCDEFNHNHMRFTRMLLAMNYLGFAESAKKIFNAVSANATEKTSIEFWKSSVQGDSTV